jgi:hypothetical protein
MVFPFLLLYHRFFFRLIDNEINMSITTEYSPSTSRTDTVEPINDVTDAVNGNSKTLVIVLAVTLPTLACIALVITLIVCYRRRQTTIWLNKLGNFILVLKEYINHFFLIV